MTASPYAIGSDHLPGLSKLIEELGEVSQVAGKIIGLGHMGEHWDGSNLKVRLQEEIGDLMAAILFFQLNNDLDFNASTIRIEQKIALFEQWHSENRS